MSAGYRSYLKTLRRVPDDIVLSVATRDLDINNGNQCVCGWVIRESIARFANMDASETMPTGTGSWDIISSCMARFGGEEDEWYNIYWGIASENRRSPQIERAFVERVLECVP